MSQQIFPSLSIIPARQNRARMGLPPNVVVTPSNRRIQLIRLSQPIPRTIVRLQAPQMNQINVSQTVEIDRDDGGSRNDNNSFLDPETTEKLTQKHQFYMHNYCEQLIKERSTEEGRLECNVCGIPVADRHQYVASRRCVEHARTHLRRATFQCRFCDFTSAKFGSAQYHLRKVHNSYNYSGNLIDLSEKFKEDLLAMIHRCYGPKSEERTPNTAPMVAGDHDFFAAPPADNNSQQVVSTVPGLDGIRIIHHGETTQSPVNEYVKRIKDVISGTHTYCKSHNQEPKPKAKINHFATKKESDVLGHFRHVLSTRTIDAGNNVNCSICQRQVSLRFSWSAIEHAMMHLEKYFFYCRHCNYRSKAKRPMLNHLITRHQSLMSEDAYDDRRDMDEIKTVIDYCFGLPNDDGGLRQFLAGLIARQQSELGGRCRHLISGYARNNKLQCRKCRLKLNFSQSDRRNPVTHLIVDHATRHLAKPLYKCNYCPKWKSYQEAMRIHGRKYHRNTPSFGRYQNHTHEYTDEILSMLDQCFAWERGEKEEEDQIEMEDLEEKVDVRNGTAGAKVETNQEKSAILSHCENVVVNHIAKNDQLTCSVCQQTLSSTNTKTVLDHAVSHLQTELYSCRLCEFQTRKKRLIWSHLRKQHKRLRSQNLYEMEAYRSVDVVKGIIDYCYGGREAQERLNFSLPEEVLKQLEPAKKKFIHTRCHGFIRKFAKSGRLQCQLCPSTVKVDHHIGKSTYVLTRYAIDHATKHLGRPIYQCQRCSCWETRRHQMVVHIKQVHHVSSVNAYVDHGPDYVSEILLMLDKCYDREQDEESVEDWEDGRDENEKEDGMDWDGEMAGNRTVKMEIDPESGFQNGSLDEKDFSKLPAKMEFFMESKFVCGDVTMYQCPLCIMKSKHEALVWRHIKLMHS